MINSNHINGVLDRLRRIFEEASEVIEALKPGERIPATTLAAKMAPNHGMTGPSLYPVLKFLIDKGYPNRIIKRGAHGGIENPLPKKNDMPAAKAIADNQETDNDNQENK